MHKNWRMDPAGRARRGISADIFAWSMFSRLLRGEMQRQQNDEMKMRQDVIGRDQQPTVKVRNAFKPFHWQQWDKIGYSQQSPKVARRPQTEGTISNNASLHTTFANENSSWVRQLNLALQRRQEHNILSYSYFFSSLMLLLDHSIIRFQQLLPPSQPS